MTSLLGQETKPTGLASSGLRVALAFLLFVAVLVVTIVALVFSLRAALSVGMLVVGFKGGADAYRVGSRQNDSSVWTTLVGTVAFTAAMAVLSLVLVRPPYSVFQSLAMSLIRVFLVVNWAYLAGLMTRGLADPTSRRLAAVSTAGLMFGVIVAIPDWVNPDAFGPSSGLLGAGAWIAVTRIAATVVGIAAAITVVLRGRLVA